MRFHEFNTLTRNPEPREAASDEALLLVFPDELTEIEVFIRERDDIEIMDRIQQGINDGVLFYVRCEDEWVAQGLERAWTCFQVFLRILKAQHH
ncbi:hypothetical protein [Microvirga sp. 17 mud 1-3]|uniref:hypothetical protein n=1 Tax=Microvirga sp. 17 mud 1-3 TaxID=2082949 RepID=UPI000D6A80C1|nr:hypothetical protein [Microvirga sp. 17 mud 1-3]AWM86806.1 hypothetical protein C4E04_08765 [Microvirga sp. 17 mud 1-3]